MGIEIMKARAQELGLILTMKHPSRKHVCVRLSMIPHNIAHISNEVGNVSKLDLCKYPGKSQGGDSPPNHFRMQKRM
jgi:hypothetical protein